MTGPKQRRSGTPRGSILTFGTPASRDSDHRISNPIVFPLNRTGFIRSRRTIESPHWSR